jgi:hypothetical protein
MLLWMIADTSESVIPATPATTNVAPILLYHLPDLAARVMGYAGGFALVRLEEGDPTTGICKSKS